MVDVSKIVKKAEEAFERRNYEYAVNLYRQVIDLDPNHTDARKALRISSLKWAEARGDKGGKGFTSFLTKGKSFFKTKVSKNLEGRIKTCENHLTKDPNNLAVRLDLGLGLKEAEHIDGAIVELEVVFQLDPRNAKAAKALAECYNHKGGFKKAIEYYGIVQKLDPSDRTVESALKNLLARDTMKKGWDEAKGSRDMMKDKKKAADMEREHHLLRGDEEMQAELERLEGELKTATSKKDQIKFLRKMAEIQDQKKDWDAAMATMKRAVEIAPENAALRFKAGDYQLRKFDHQIIILKKKLKKTPQDQELRKKMREWGTRKTQFGIEEFRWRVSEHPTDLGLRFELGKYLFLAGQTDGCIKEFQQAVKDPKRKLESLTFLGRAFQRKKMFDLATTQFRKALEAHLSPTSSGALGLRYDLASVMRDNGDLEGALDEFKKIMELDIDYRDIGAQIERIKKMKKKG